jgi:hypothetical protein
MSVNKWIFVNFPDVTSVTHMLGLGGARIVAC